MGTELVAIHMILAWNEIGRSAIFGREIGVPDREVFSQKNTHKKLVNNLEPTFTV